MITTKLVIPTYIDKKEIKTEGISLVRMLVTPEIAAFWLKTYNLSNRPLSDNHVLFLSSQMKKGQWIEGNGNTISFNTKCQLNDGQHRLAAVVKSKLSFVFSIMVGVDVNAFKVTDTGKSRGASDVLAIEGYSYSNSLAAITKFIMHFKANRISDASTGGKGKGGISITNSDVLIFVRDNKDKLIPIVSKAAKYSKQGDKLIPISYIGGLLYILSEYDYRQSDKFIYQLATGSNIDHNNSIYVLRKRLRLAKDSASISIPMKTKIAFILKTWNAVRKGKKITYLRQDKAHSFPKII